MIPYSVDTIFFTGVVEDRNDPLFLGRVRVRIHGFHSQWKQDTQQGGDLPGANNIAITDLPWAMPMQPITSAAMTGIGHAPVGPVEGTWVFGIFLDGEDRQQPFILGTMGGIELKAEQDGGASSPGINTFDNSQVPVAPVPASPVTPNPVTVPTDTSVQKQTGGALGPLSDAQYQAYKNALGKRESSNNYGAVNQYGYIGKYQMGAGALYDQGYVKSPKQANLTDPSDWTGKDGVNSQSDFLNNPTVQETEMDSYTRGHYNSLLSNGVVDENTSPGDVGGYLATSHLLGVGGAKKLKNGSNGSDANGTTGASYFALGKNAVNGAGGAPTPPNTPPPPPPPVVSPPAPTNFTPTPSQSPGSPSTFNDAMGFRDPNKVYPKFDDGIDKRPDTNYLAYSDHLDKTSITQKEHQRQIGTKVANQVDPDWSQPKSPYNANYPFNHVYQSESGHVLEFDDTMGNERINMWHKSGTFYEIDRNGTMVTHIIGDGYHIIDRNGYIFIAGKCDITTGGSARIYVQKDAEVQVDGNINLTGFGDLKANISGKIDIAAKDSMNLRVKSLHIETDGNTNGESISIKTKLLDDPGNDGTIKIHSARDLQVLVDKEVQVTAAKKISVHSQDIVAIDGDKGLYENSQMSVDATDIRRDLGGQESMFIPAPPKSTTEPTFPTLNTPSRADKQAFFYDEPGYPPDEVTAFINNQIAAGNVTQQQLNQAANVPTVVDKTPPPATSPSTTIAPIPPSWGSMPSFSPSMMISNSFTLGQLSSQAIMTPATIVPQFGLTVGNIAGNLSNVATAALDSIIAKYPSVIVASGFRLATGSSFISTHELGQAVDLQFLGYSLEEHYDIASYLRDNLPIYSQLILQYQTTGSGQPFIHLSVVAGDTRKQTLTMMNHVVVAGSISTFGNLVSRP